MRLLVGLTLRPKPSSPKPSAATLSQQAWSRSVALLDGVIKAGLICEVSGSSPRFVAAGIGVCRVPVPTGVIVVAVRWYLRFNLSYRDVEELLMERGVEVDHVTVHRWVQRFAPLLADAARFARHSRGDRWFVDETYVKVNGVWRYVYRAIDQNGQVIDVLISAHRDAATARRFFQRALTMLKVPPSEVVTDAAPIYATVLEELIPSAWHHVERHANNLIEADHSQLKHRPRPMRGDSEQIKPHRWSSPGTPSCRISAGDTPNSPSAYLPPDG